MAARKSLCFAVFVSFVILAAGSRSSLVDTEAVVAPSLMGVSFDCVYTVFVETGSIWKAGTDSVISLTLHGADSGYGITIRNLVQWGGLMGAGYDYFERGNVDVFSGRGPCLASPPCRMNITSDGSGDHHSWYCKSVEVTATRQHGQCTKAEFAVGQWLSRDVPPYQLYAEPSLCGKSSQDGDAEPAKE